MMALTAAAAWLAAHPRGHIEMLAAECGFIVSRSSVDTEGGDIIEAGTGFGETLEAALAAAMREGE